MIQYWLNYNAFVKDRIFQHLIDIFNRKIHAQETYSRFLTDIIQQVTNKANVIEVFMKQHAKEHQQLHIYSQIFRQVKKELQNEANQLQAAKEEYQTSYIYTLQSCKISMINNQKDVIRFAEKELKTHQNAIISVLKEARDKEEQIQTIKKQSFTYMLTILNEFDNDLIKDKYLQKQTQKSFKFYGSKRKQMNQMIDQITYLEQEGEQKLKEITQIQKQRLQFIEKICDKCSSIEKDKINLLLKMCSQFKNSQPSLLDFTVDFKKDITFNELEKPLFKNQEFKEHYRKSAYVLLNPHPQNQLLIQHRQSLAKKVSNSQLRNNRNAHYYAHDVSLNFQVGNFGKQAKTDYDGYLQFLQSIRNTLGSSYLSQHQLQDFMKYFKSNLRKKPLRQVFLFYLYELGKIDSTIIGLLLKDTKILIEMINLLLTTCLDYYDTQSTVKILILIYHINIPEQVDLYQSIRNHKIWRSFQFWETSFLESVYEYFEMIIIYYHKSIDEYVSKKGAQHQQKNNWFVNLFRMRQKQPQQKKKKDQAHIAKDFLHQILKNLALIYLCNMILMVVPAWIIQKFEKYIFFLYQKLNIKPQYLQELKRLRDMLFKKNQGELRKLLKNDNVLDKIMSKLIGTSEQDRDSVMLSKSIADWIDKK